MLLLLVSVLLPAAASCFQFVGVVSPALLGEAVRSESGDLERHAQCRADWQRWEAALSRQEFWAVRMADSWTKTVTGVLQGNANDLGDFNECMQTSSVSEASVNSSAPVIRPAYILPVVSLTLASQERASHVTGSGALLRAVVPVTLRVAACVPDSCEAGLLRAALQAVAERLLREEALAGDFKVAVSLPAGKQSESTTRKPGPGDWAFVAVIVLLLLLAVTATILDDKLDRSQHKEARYRWRWLLVFSMSASWRRLMAPAPPGSMNCINGIRVFTIVYITVGHAANFFPAVMNQRDMSQDIVRMSFMVVSRYYHGVDTFLAIGGMLCCISFLRSVKKKGSFNFFEYVVHRYARVTPVLAIVTGFGATWFDLVRDGVDSSQYGAFTQTDWYKKYWWASLLYISNYTADFYHFFQHTWYLSVDMQLYVLAPLVLIPLWKRPLAAIVLISVGTVGLCAVPGYLGMAFKARSTFGAGITDQFKLADSRIAMYPSTHTRFPSYLAGIAAGYFLHQIKYGGLKLTLTRFHATIMWLLSGAIALAVLFAPYSVENELNSHPYNPVEVFFYLGFEKLAWSVFVLLVIIACETGCGGIANKILSWGAFTALGRLCLNIYLVHFFIITMDQFYLGHNLEYFSTYNVIRKELWLLAFTLPFAALLFIVVEQPFILLEGEVWKLARGGGKPTTKVVQDESFVNAQAKQDKHNGGPSAVV